VKSENLSSVRRQVITRSGLLVDPLALKTGDILIEDVAHSLAHECRWRGVLGRRSVAWHSYAVAMLLGERGCSHEVQMLGLLHDMAEVFIGDIATPVKKTLLDVEQAEYEIFTGMWEALRLPAGAVTDTHWKHVKEADADTGAFEYRVLATRAMRSTWMPTYGANNGKGAWPDMRFEEPHQAEARLEFLARFADLRKKI
jgi:5'-deoxynucleotidase YfbR-like HD superfamily hydrolase